MHSPSRSKSWILGGALIAVSCAVLSAYSLYFRSTETAEVIRKSQRQVEQIMRSEKLILRLQQQLKQLSQSAYNLKVPDWETKGLFTAKVVVVGLQHQPAPHTRIEAIDFKRQSWPIAPVRTEQPSDQLAIFGPILQNTSYVEQFSIKIVRGQFEGTGTSREDKFATDLLIQASGKKKSSKTRFSLEAHAVAHWENLGKEAGITDWRIAQWRFEDLTIVENTSSELFVKVNNALIPSARERADAERCIQDELIISLIKTGTATLPGPKYEFDFDFDTGPLHPGVCVVDINNDGWDDFYLMSRWQRNRLFRNRGDGTFEECAAEYGLAIEAHCTSAVFADFDNDGDQDLFLGRSAQRSMYLMNHDGHFEDVSKKLVDVRLPAIVTSVSAADYNGDGLLDVLLSTYGAEDIARTYLSTEEQKILASQFDGGTSQHPYLDGVGIANLLLVNLGGGRFTEAKESSQLELWRTTFQASWSDYDADGDPDVYFCNDFGPDRLMRNDFPNGFTDVTYSEGHATMKGFGMGASWGDYDLDGQQDLYVSNMYSKAGLRITEQVPGIDSSFVESANGNRLYRKQAKSYEQTSGLDSATTIQVAKAGWSWGGQFVDFDNDTYLDIYVVNGYFTAPEEVAYQDDL